MPLVRHDWSTPIVIDHSNSFLVDQPFALLLFFVNYQIMNDAERLLPRDMWLEIFTFLTPVDLARVASVSQAFSQFARDDALVILYYVLVIIYCSQWRPLVFDHFPDMIKVDPDDIRQCIGDSARAWFHICTIKYYNFSLYESVRSRSNGPEFMGEGSETNHQKCDSFRGYPGYGSILLKYF